MHASFMKRQTPSVIPIKPTPQLRTKKTEGDRVKKAYIFNEAFLHSTCAPAEISEHYVDL